MKVSIVIPLFKINELFYGCMESLKQFNPVDEVIIIHSNGSFAENCNKGIKATDSEYVCLLNDDTVVTEGWLQKLVDFMDSHPQAAAVSPMMLFPDGHVQFGGMIFHNNYRGGHLHWHRWQGDPDLIREPHQFQATTFGCVLLRREAIIDLRILKSDTLNPMYLDETYKIGGFEDIDWCFRAKLNGWEIWYEPNSKIFHYESQTFRRMDNQDERMKQAYENMNIYLNKWKPYFENGTFKFDDTEYIGGLDNFKEMVK